MTGWTRNTYDQVTGTTVLGRIIDNSTFHPCGCVTYDGARAGALRRYAQVRYRGRMVYVHRAAYEILVSPLPSFVHLDHLCLNTTCIVPEHLDPVSNRENVIRGIKRKEEGHGPVCNGTHESAANQ